MITGSTGGSMIQIDNKTNTPIFDQIFLEVRRMIALGIYKEGEQIPTVRQLARELGVNPNTVSKAYSKCENYGLIESKPGLGYFVQAKDSAIQLAVASYEDKLKTIFANLKDLGLNNDQLIALAKGALHD